MSNFYSNLQKTATALITDKGQLLAFSYDATETYSPTTGAVTPGSTVTINAYAATVNTESQEGPDGQVVGVIKTLIVEQTTTPIDVDMYTTIDGEVYRVTKINPYKPAGQLLAQEVTVSK